MVIWWVLLVCIVCLVLTWLGNDMVSVCMCIGESSLGLWRREVCCHFFLALMRVKIRVNLVACSVWVMKCTAWLCLANLRPLRCWFLHKDRRWGHVSRSFLWHIVQLGLGWVRSQNMFLFYDFP